MFNIDFTYIFTRTLPHFLRVALNLIFVTPFIVVLGQVNAQLVTLADATDFKLRWNNQVMFLEEYLNTVYDPSLKRIWIENINNPAVFIHQKTEPVDPLIIYQKSEAQPPIILRTKTEIQGELDYIVHVPVSITFVLEIITAQIKVYNVAGKRFEIQTF